MIACDRKWGTGYWNHDAGSGSTAVRDGVVLRATSPGAQVYRTIELSGGATLRFSCMARNLSGEGFLYIDSPLKGGGYNQDVARVTSRDFEEYSVTYTVPFNEANVPAIIGVGNSIAATGPVETEYVNPRLEIINGGGFEALRTMACCLLRNIGSGWEVHPDYCCINVASVTTTSGADNFLTVTLDVPEFRVNLLGRSRRPIPMVSGTPDNTSFYPVAGRLSGFDASGPMTVRVALVDPATKAAINPATLTNAYVALDVRMF